MLVHEQFLMKYILIESSLNEKSIFVGISQIGPIMSILRHSKSTLTPFGL